MSRFDHFPDRAMEMASNVGDRIRGAMPADFGDRVREAMPSDIGARLRRAVPSNVGDRIRQAMPSKAGGLLETGVALGALKTGSRLATGFIRRNPTLVVAAAAGAGLLWYAARRKARKAEHGPIEGSARRVEAGRADAGSRDAGDTTSDSSDGSAVSPSASAGQGSNQ